jgi:hypothetical protein
VEADELSGLITSTTLEAMAAKRGGGGEYQNLLTRLEEANLQLTEAKSKLTEQTGNFKRLD